MFRSSLNTFGFLYLASQIPPSAGLALTLGHSLYFRSDYFATRFGFTAFGESRPEKKRKYYQLCCETRRSGNPLAFCVALAVKEHNL
jgi:hypothetical protein